VRGGQYGGGSTAAAVAVKQQQQCSSQSRRVYWAVQQQRNSSSGSTAVTALGEVGRTAVEQRAQRGDRALYMDETLRQQHSTLAPPSCESFADWYVCACLSVLQ
jgi:hypothetical protein